jgi:hypothetical protein
MIEFKTLFDVYRWATRTGSVVDTNPQIFHPCGLFEEDMEKVEKIFERHLWTDRQKLMPLALADCSERYLATDGQRVTIINHGYDSTWVDSNGLPFDFTHWMHLPELPG